MMRALVLELCLFAACVGYIFAMGPSCSPTIDRAVVDCAQCAIDVTKLECSRDAGRD